MRPFQVLFALLVVATVLVATALALRARRAQRDGDDGVDVDAPLQRLRGFHIFGPDEDEEHRRVHVPVLPRERPAAPPPPSAPVVTRTFLPPPPPSAPKANGSNGSNGSNGHVTLTGTAAAPRPLRPAASQRPNIDDQLGRDILLVEDDDSIATMYLMLLGSRGDASRHARGGV